MTVDGAAFPKRATMRTMPAENSTELAVEEVDTDARVPRCGDAVRGAKLRPVVTRVFVF